MATESIRSVILELIKKKFGGFSIWNKIESDIAIKCAELQEPTTDNKKKAFYDGMEDIKSHLLDQGIDIDDLRFIDEEIENHKFTKTMSLYVEEDDSVDSTIIEKYSRLGRDTEGVVGIHHPFNYKQLSRLTNGVFNKTGLIKFYISKEQKIYGKIVAEIEEYAQKIPVANLVEARKKNKDGDPIYQKIFLFGQKPDTHVVTKIKEIYVPFYIYRFITESKQELILLTSTQCEIGDYMIEGVMTQCDDYKQITESAKIPTKLPFFFAQTIKNRIIKFRTHEELFDKIKSLGINKKTFFDFPFTIMKNNVAWKLLQPDWYKWLIWSWITHESKGVFNNYPLHIMVLGPKHSGKSLLLNGLHSRSKETSDVFSGSSSTMKHLVPSFKYAPARLGYLAESSRFAYCDEFLRCITNTRTTNDGSAREESVAMMNDLLEHQKRQAGSGVSSVNVNMTARILSTTNPVRGVRNVADLIRLLDESFLSRWLIYYQNEDHVQMVRKSNDSKLERYNFDISTNDWISIIDYLQTFSSKYDTEIMEKIYDSLSSSLPESLLKHYDARHKHHIECLLDGIIKTRCIMEKDHQFIAKEEDYEKLKEVWYKIIASWLTPDQIQNVDQKDRIFYLPEKSQYIYWKIADAKKQITKSEIKEMVSKDMNLIEFEEAWVILLETEMIYESHGFVKPYYIKENKQVKL